MITDLKKFYLSLIAVILVLILCFGGLVSCYNGNSVDSTIPNNPNNPNNPSDPNNPNNPNNPSNPDIPTKPDIPTDPDVPTNPDVPTDPEKPVNPPIDTTFRFESDGNYFYGDRSYLIGRVERQQPELTGSLPRYPISINPTLSNLTTEEIDAIYAENELLIGSIKTDIANGTLKKHVAADGQFYGTISKDTPAVIKDFLIDTRRGGGRTLGFAPAGEIVKITLPKNVTATLFIGYEDWKYNIPRAKFSASHNRMPMMTAAFNLVGGDNYIGSPFGGSLSMYISANQFPPFEIRVEGVIENPVFNYGITTNEEWQSIRELPGLTAEIYTQYARLVMPSSKIRNTDDMQAIADYWYKVGCLSTYATNQEVTRSYPCTLNFDTYVAAGAAVNIGGSFTMQPLGAADFNADPYLLLYNQSWGNMHEYNHSFQNSGGVRWGLEASGEITNNVLSILSMIQYTDIASKRTESPMAFREDTTDPYNCFTSTMRWYNDDKIEDYTGYWSQGGIHYNYFVFADIAHAFGVDNAVKFIRSYGDGSAPVLDGFNGGAGANAKETLLINRRDFALRAAKVLGYDMTYYLNTINKMHLDLDDNNPDFTPQIKALGLPEFIPAANLYAYGRNDGITKAQSGRPFSIPYGNTYDFDFVGKTLSPLSFTVAQPPTSKNGTFQLLDNGKYRYTNNGNPANDPFSFTIQFANGKQIEFFGEIAFSFNTLDVQVWENMRLSTSEANLIKAAEHASKNPATLNLKYNYGVGIPSSNSNTNFYRIDGKLIAPETGTYTFYTKADDCGYFYLSTDSSETNLQVIVKNIAFSNTYTDAYKSQPIQLIKGKIYYFRFDVLNSGGAGSGNVGYKINDGAIVNIPSTVVCNSKYNDTEIESLTTSKTYYLDNQYKTPFVGIGTLEKLPKTKFSILSAPRNTSDTKYQNMIDGNEGNYYYSTASGERKIVVDFGEALEFNRFAVVPHPGNRNGDIGKYAIYASNDNVTFTKLNEGSSLGSGRIDCIFDSTKARYFMLEVVEGKAHLAFAELNFFKAFDSRYGITGKRNDCFTYSEKPDIEKDGIYQSNFLVLLKENMTATTTFDGRNLAIFTEKRPNAGKFEIFIDDVSYGIVDLSSDTTLYRQNVFLTSNLSTGKHTLVIKCIEGVATLDFIQFNTI